MAQFDVTFKHLVEYHPEDWVRLASVEPEGPVKAVDADVSTVSAEADKVIRVEGELPWILHLEAQASHDARLPERMHRYNVLLSYRHDLPVHSVALLLRRDAHSPAITGAWSRSLPVSGEYVRFQYLTIRVWELHADELLQMGGGVLPLATLTDDAQPRLRSIIQECRQRAYASHPRQEAVEMLASQQILLGMLHPTDLVQTMFRGVVDMTESTVYQSILEEGEQRGLAKGREEGREEGVRQSILRIGEKRFGPADASVRQALEAIHDFDQLSSLLDTALSADDWNDLLNGSTPD